jgi:hypothetical protein
MFGFIIVTAAVAVPCVLSDVQAQRLHAAELAGRQVGECRVMPNKQHDGLHVHSPAAMLIVDSRQQRHATASN